MKSSRKHINNPDMEREGKDDKIAGTVQEKVDQIKTVYGY